MQKGSKVVFVMPWHISERGGGAEVQANFLAQELGLRGFEVSYVCQTITPNKINTTEKLGNIQIYFLKPSGRFPWSDQNKYLKPLNTIQPDYILQRMSSNVTYVLSKYSSKTNCKLVWFCTDNKNPVANFHFQKFKEHSTIRRLGLIKYCVFGFSNKLMDYYRKIGMKKVNIAFTQNDFQKEQVKRNFNLESERMISGHPIPEHLISIPQRFKNKTILWCANWGPHKRPELFIELASKMQHTDLKFVMVGGHGNKNYVDQLLRNKPKNLTTTGKLSFEDALAYFDNASVFVNTSAPGGDGFPNTFIQSWLRQTPVVSLGFDPDNIVTENLLGFIVSSINETINCLESLFQNEAEYKSMSTNVFNYAFENHSLKRMTDNFLSVLDNKQSSNVK